MKIEKLIKKLETLRDRYGNLTVRASTKNVDSLNHDEAFDLSGYLISYSKGKVRTVTLCNKVKPPVKKKRPKYEALRDLLSLVGIFPTDAEIKKWTPKQKELAENWAAKTHLAASDNHGVKVPKRPWFIGQPWTKEAGFTDQLEGRW